MSTGTKRPHADALADAEALRALFPPECYERWEFAGSIRRHKPEVGDVEHLIIPRWGDARVTVGLFQQLQHVNLLWHHLDALWQGGQVERHIYGQTGLRWGPIHRGIDFRNFTHEFWLTDADNWGWQMVVRTGPAAFSERVVTNLKYGRMYRQQGGNLIHVASGRPVKVPDEQTYLNFARMPWTPPEARR